MTITTDMSKADLITAIGQTLIEEKRTEEAILFYRLASLARDAQEVLALIPDELEIEYATAN